MKYIIGYISKDNISSQIKLHLLPIGYYFNFK